MGGSKWEGCKVGRVQSWKGAKLECARFGRCLPEGCKVGRCKVGRCKVGGSELETFKVGRCKVGRWKVGGSELETFLVLVVSSS